MSSAAGRPFVFPVERNRGAGKIHDGKRGVAQRPVKNEDMPVLRPDPRGNERSRENVAASIVFRENRVCIPPRRYGQEKNRPVSFPGLPYPGQEAGMALMDAMPAFYASELPLKPC